MYIYGYIWRNILVLPWVHGPGPCAERCRLAPGPGPGPPRPEGPSARAPQAPGPMVQGPAAIVGPMGLAHRPMGESICLAICIHIYIYKYIYIYIYSALVLGHWSFSTITFRANELKVHSLPSKYSLSELIPVIPLIPLNDPSRWDKPGRSGPMFYTSLGQR